MGCELEVVWERLVRDCRRRVEVEHGLARGKTMKHFRALFCLAS
jgi:hypothetical protein